MEYNSNKYPLELPVKKPFFCRLSFALLVLSCLFLALLSLASAAGEIEPTPPATLAETLLEGLLEEREIISLSHLSPVTEEEIGACYSTLYATNPALFFVSSHYTLGTSGGTPLYLRPTYRFTREERQEREADMIEKMDEILAACGSSLTKEETVALLHDEMIARFSYDTERVNYDAYSLLETGKGVCQAYALLFKALCDRAGVACECVPAFDANHEWNRVYLDGTWLHLDLTWDEADSTPTYVARHYFLMQSHPAASP